MKRPRSIILTVVSAKSDFALQEVTSLARQLDPRGERTLGLITKPDTLDVGSESERAYLELAQNKDVHFALGWHVLKNRNFAMRNATSAERDEDEDKYFSSGVWTLLKPNQLGVKPLRPRLSNVLKDHILRQLPSLIEDVKSGIQNCNDILAKLGATRATLADQRRYIGKAGQEFSALMQVSVDGVYINDSFFGSALTEEGYQRRLRAVVQNTLQEFNEEMHKQGRSRFIVVKAPKGNPRAISRSDYIDEVKDLMRRNRGRELPGTWSPLIVGELFREQCRPWKGIIDKYTDKILTSVYQVINDVLETVAIGETMDGIRREIINPGMERLTKRLQDKVAEILYPHYSGHPITYNHYLTETVQKLQNERRRKDLETSIKRHLSISPGGFAHHGFPSGTASLTSLVDKLIGDTEQDMEQYASSLAIDFMEAYYKVSFPHTRRFCHVLKTMQSSPRSHGEGDLGRRHNIARSS